MRVDFEKTMKSQVGSFRISTDIEYAGTLFESPLVARFAEEVLQQTEQKEPAYRIATLMAGIKAFKKELL